MGPGYLQAGAASGCYDGTCSQLCIGATLCEGWRYHGQRLVVTSSHGMHSSLSHDMRASLGATSWVVLHLHRSPHLDHAGCHSRVLAAPEQPHGKLEGGLSATHGDVAIFTAAVAKGGVVAAALQYTAAAAGYVLVKELEVSTQHWLVHLPHAWAEDRLIDAPGPALSLQPQRVIS